MTNEQTKKLLDEYKKDPISFRLKYGATAESELLETAHKKGMTKEVKKQTAKHGGKMKKKYKLGETAGTIGGQGGRNPSDIVEIIKDAGAKTATDIAAVKNMLDKFKENNPNKAMTKQNVKDATERHLKKRNPHFEESGGLINKYPKMGNQYNKGGSVKIYAKGGGVRTANNSE